ncbi:MAG: rhomboid family intramembrane serine protease [Bacilli bacterium]|nr:rhomboid family intramembrane serine protease [Bacilli bacterium]
MKQELTLDEKNILAMKLLHYFITEKDYNPIILQGVENEIWLENLNEDCKVVRIVSNYIHNNEQLKFDTFKTQKILGKIKKKTLSFNMNVMSIFLDLGENVKLSEMKNDNHLMAVNVTEEKDIKDSEVINKVFPDLDKKLKYSEEGEELFMKITKEINEHNQEDARKVEKVFKMKYPMITYTLIAINVIFFLVPILLNEYDSVYLLLCSHAPSIRAGQYYRLFTAMFYHGGFFHLLLNCYSLYVVGSQMESFLGKIKFLIIYLVSGFVGALCSMCFIGSSTSVGASGAIFGLLGSMVYFGYHYRVYLGNVMKSQIIPLIALNLAIGFMNPQIDNAAHVGGLIGGVLITMALGVEGKSTNFEKINGWILTGIFTAFLGYMAFVYLA